MRIEGRDQHGGDILRARVRPGRRELDEARERRRVGLVGNRMRVQRVFADARRRGNSRVAGPFSTIVQPRGPAEVDDDDATLRDENVARVQIPMGDAAPRERQARFHEAGERPNRAGLVEGAHRLAPGHGVADALGGAGRPDRAFARRLA